MESIAENLTPEKIQKFLSHRHRLNLLFQWVEDDIVTYNQFLMLLEEDKKENQRQYDLDSLW